MDRKTWNRKIKAYCKKAGTYKPFFEGAIDTLAGIMEHRDQALEVFESGGRQVVMEYTNKGGATNLVKNPALQMILECNAQALNYWRDLGLTSKSWQAMMKEEQLNASNKPGSLEDALANLGV